MRALIVLCALAAALGALAAYSILVEPDMLEVTHTVIESPRVGEPVRIAFVADMQRRDADPSFVARAVAEVNAAAPDIVAMGGDYVEAAAPELPSVAALRDVEAPGGAFAVLGNHDYGVYGPEKGSMAADVRLAAAVAGYLSEGGAVRVLRNEVVDAAGGAVRMAGLDSYWAGMRDESALDGLGGDAYRVVLVHNQEGMALGADSDRPADLYLFGHTHCGQVRLPLLGSVPKVLGFKGEYDYRHYEVAGGSADVYTTCGLAPWPRLLNPPEVSIIDIVPARGRGGGG